ncbi:tyrosine-type recombinase/integrase [Streptomyces sp. NPDC002754]
MTFPANDHVPASTAAIGHRSGFVALRDPLNVAISAWRSQMRTDSYSEKTIKLRSGVLLKICTDQNVPDGRLKEAHVRDFIDDGDYMPNTVLAYLRALRKWGQFFGIDDPTARIRRPRTPEFVPRPVTEPQLDVLLASANPRMAAWIKLGAYTGLRASEVANLRGSQFYDQGTSITLYVQGKGDKTASLPIARHVADTIRPFIGTSERLWDVNPVYVSQQFRLYSQSLGLNLGFHQNRHRFGTILYKTTRDLLMTQRLMRHASPKQTTAYVLVSDDAAPIVDSLPSFNTLAAPDGPADTWSVRMSY